MDFYSISRTFVLLFILILFGYYLIPAGLSYYFFYVLKPRQWQNRHIQNRFPTTKSVNREIKWSLSTVLIFSLLATIGVLLVKLGKTKLYFSIEDSGWVYLACSVIIYILIHDTYFYWFHRLLHVKGVFRWVHRTHHLSTTPSPFASLSFSPVEAVIQFGINLLMIFLIPLHPLAIGLFIVYNILLNTAGHLGFEIVPKYFFQYRLLKHGLTVTHHDMHHSKLNCNYGLCLNFWDRIMRTNHVNYEKTLTKL